METAKSVDLLHFAEFLIPVATLQTRSKYVRQAWRLQSEMWLWTNFISRATQRYSISPVPVHKKFPNILGYNAINCSVREVSREKFEKLNKLSAVNLSKNYIETIADDTFENLSKLQEIDLYKLKNTVGVMKI